MASNPKPTPARGRWTRVAAGLALFAVLLVGTASAYHLSAGTSDAVGLAPDESPDDPSVPEPMHERGTGTDCYEPDPVDPDPVAAAGSDAFCGRLLYHAGTVYEQMAPRDQQVDETTVGTFDVVYASYVGTYGIGTCAPWCFPGGEPVYRGLHDLGAEAGVSDDGEQAYESDQGWQTYGPDLALPNAARTLQANTGAWTADGWVHPAPDQRFVAFLEDEGGDPIDDTRLAQIVAGHADLSQGVLPHVCGFTPDADVASPEASPGCEIVFSWQGPEDADGQACSAPGYACGTLGPAWHATVVCSAAPGACAPRAETVGEAAAEPGRLDDPAASTIDYDVWHWVVAPTPSACGGHQEPGFDVDPDNAEARFLAHDLDVFVPAVSASGLQGSENGHRLAWAIAEEHAQPPTLPGVPSPTDDLEQATLVAKDDRVEPNAPGDTSQSAVTVDRDPNDPCRSVLETTEDPELVDPWVEILDAQVYRNFWLDSILGVDPWMEGLERRTYQQPPVTSVFGDANDAYLTRAEDQDASNRPGPWMYSAGGQLGVFADKDDDGRYDQAPNSRLFDAIDEIGAYPLFWDVRVDEIGTIDTEAGCRLGSEGARLSEAMAQAGYGSRTGMIMVVDKPQPTVLYEWRTSQLFPQTVGQTYVLLSQSLHAQREDADVQDAIQAALDRLPREVSLADERVVFPGELIAPASDFYEACGYPTGGFHTSWSFTHAAQMGPGATLVTSYLLDNQAAEGKLGGEGPIPAFEPHGEPYAFDTGLSQWFDVDPLDGDPSRNTEQCSAPPHDGDRC